MEESFPEVLFGSLPELGLTQTTRGFMDVKLMGRWKEAPNARSGLPGHCLASFLRNNISWDRAAAQVLWADVFLLALERLQGTCPAEYNNCEERP